MIDQSNEMGSKVQDQDSSIKEILKRINELKDTIDKIYNKLCEETPEEVMKE